MPRSRSLTAIGALAVLAACNPLWSQSLTTMPENAQVVIKVNNLSKTSASIGKLCEQWGIAALQPQAADPLGSLSAAAGIKQGLRGDGELAIVILPGMAGQSVLAYLPVTNFKAFVANFPDAKTDGAVTSFVLPENGMPGFLKESGNYAIFSTEREVLEKPANMVPFSPLTAKEMAGRDVAVYVNIRAFRQPALAGVNFIKSMVMEQVTQKVNEAGGQRQAMLPMIRAAVGQYITAFTRFMTDTQSLSYSFSISEQGIHITNLAEFEKNSYLAGLSAELKGSSESLTTGLPAGKYMMVGGMTFEKAYIRMIDDAAKPVVAEAAKLGASGKPVIDAVEAFKSFIAASRQNAFAASTNQGKIGEGPLVSAVSIVEGDAKAILDSQRQIARHQEQLMAIVDTEAATSVKSTIKENAATVSGVQFDEVTQVVELQEANSPQAAMQKLIYGNSGMVAKVGIVNPKMVLTAQGIDDATLAKAVEAAKSRSEVAVTPEMKTLAAKLPKNRLAEIYFSLEHGATAVSKVAEAMTGSPLPLQLPENQPPVGMTLSAQPGAIQGDIYLPSTVIQNLIGAGMQAYMSQMMKDDGGL